MTRALRIFAIFAVGTAISYLLWYCYFGLLPPQLQTSAVAHKYSQKLITILSNHMSRENAVYLLTVFIKALPGAIIIGTLFGATLRYVRMRLLLCLSILTWPLIICTRYLVVFSQFGFEFDSAATGWGSADSLGWFKAEMSVALAFYSLFFLVALGSYALAKLVTHNPAFKMDALKRAP